MRTHAYGANMNEKIKRIYVIANDKSEKTSREIGSALEYEEGVEDAVLKGMIPLKKSICEDHI